jgi:hypothetical protein
MVRLVAPPGVGSGRLVAPPGVGSGRLVAPPGVGSGHLAALPAAGLARRVVQVHPVAVSQLDDRLGAALAPLPEASEPASSTAADTTRPQRCRGPVAEATARTWPLATVCGAQHKCRPCAPNFPGPYLARNETAKSCFERFLRQMIRTLTHVIAAAAGAGPVSHAYASAGGAPSQYSAQRRCGETPGDWGSAAPPPPPPGSWRG